MTDLETLIRDLREPGGDDRELSDRFAVALGWRMEHLQTISGYSVGWNPPHNPWGDFKDQSPPLFTRNLTAIVGTLREADRIYSISAFPVESSAAIGQMIATDKWHYAPTAERALMIARLAFKKETGE